MQMVFNIVIISLIVWDIWATTRTTRPPVRSKGLDFELWLEDMPLKIGGKKYAKKKTATSQKQATGKTGAKSNTPKKTPVKKN